MKITAEVKFSGLNLQEKIPIRCPDCGHETPVQLGKLRPGHSFKCKGCGRTITNTKDFPKELEAEIRDAATKLAKSFRAS